MVVRFDNKALKDKQEEHDIGVEGDEKTAKRGVSEAEAIVADAKKHQHDESSPTESEPPAHQTIPEEKEPKEEPIKLNAEAVKLAQRSNDTTKTSEVS